MTSEPRCLRLALFDLDHTLLPLDSDYEWGEFTIRIGWNDPVEFARRNDEFYAHYQAGTLDVHDYVRFATEAVRLRGPEAAAAAHQQFMREVITPAIKPRALHLIRQHQTAGDEVLIVTATNEFVTTPIAQALGVSQLLAVQLVRDASGWYTGEIDGIPTMREGKVHRMEQWLAERQLAWGDVESTFYSDSMNDVPLLEKVNHPVATNPDPRLRALAQERGWRILDLFAADAETPAPPAECRAPCSPHQPPFRARPPERFHSMIKKFLDKLMGKSTPGTSGGKPHFGKREEVPASVHGINPELVDRRAAEVVATLKQAGFEAYIVGGAVRDLLLGLRPKDFDVATNATPEQVKGLFRRAFIIGKRFRIVHVVHGRGREHEVIEVSTFRAYLDNAAAGQVAGNEKTSKAQLSGMQHAVDASGRVLRDNVWGPQDEEDTAHDWRPRHALPRRPGAHHPCRALCSQAQRPGFQHRGQVGRAAGAVAGAAGRGAAEPHVRRNAQAAANRPRHCHH